MLDLYQEFLLHSPMPPADEQFTEAANHWDLEALYADLASAKGKRLTPMEKLHLRGLLCSFSPAEIAEKLQKNLKGVETDLSATVYQYVKNLVSKSTEKMDNWRNITQWLEEAGYKCQSVAQVPVSNLLPGNSIVNISNISIEKNQMVIVIKLQIPTSNPSEIPVQNLDLNNDNTN